MNMVIQRIFGTSVPAAPESAGAGKQLPIDEIRRTLHGTLHDCKDMRAQRMIYKINTAQTPVDLWLLRSDLHQCIAQTHSQRVAAERINSLVHVFEGWLPASQLAKI